MSSLKGFSQVSRSLKNLQKKAGNKIVRKGISKMAQVVRKEMRRNVPKKTGATSKELRYKIRRHPRGGFSAKVGASTDAYHVRFLEGGAKPHRIPKKKGGKVVLNGKVVQNIQHPGMQGNKFMSRSFRQSKDQALREAGKAMFKELMKL